MTSAIATLPQTVIRIRAGDMADRNGLHFGTGFFYAATLDEGTDGMVPLIVSNKHVLCNKAWLEFDFAQADASGDRILGPATPVRVNRGQLPIFEHPDASVDLAAIPIAKIVTEAMNAGIKLQATLLSKRDIPPPEIISVLEASSTLLMAGFPNGLMDAANNLPVVRRGSLATPYYANYQGQPNFVADIAAFGGSSGSPVFAFYDGVVPMPGGGVGLGAAPSAYLIGVLHSGPQLSATGAIEPVPVPTSMFVARTNMMMHLGYCAKAHLVEEVAALVLSAAKTKAVK